MSKYPAPNPPFIPARWFTKGTNIPKRIVMHSMVIRCYDGAAEACGHFFATETNKTSAHYGTDPHNVRQYVHDHDVAYHCGYNQNSLGIEMADAGTGPLTRWDDAEHKAMMHTTARLVAEICLAYNIRPYYVGWIRLKLGINGVTTHAQMTKAYRMSTHTDPGEWPRKDFMRLVRTNIALIKAGK